MKHVYLRPMLEWLAELDHDWSVSVGSPGKELQQLLPTDVWLDLERIYVDAPIPGNRSALFLAINLFHQVVLQVGDRLGYSYPDDLHW